MPSRRTMPAVYAAIERLQHLSALFQARRVALARSVGLTDQQWRVLEEISTEHFMPSLFAKRQESSPAAVSKILRQLQDKALISVYVAANDGRQRGYELTSTGQRTIALLRRHRQDAIDAIWSDIDPTELARFSEFSASLIRRIERYTPRETPPSATTKPARTSGAR